MTPRHTIVLDWDGTLVEAKWPEMGDWMPGAIAACLTLHQAGHKLVVSSARLSPYDPWTSQKRPAHFVEAEYQRVRAMLDAVGLTFVDIWRLHGKPGGDAYVDDKAERYYGRPGSWRALTEKLLVRFGSEQPRFPAFDQDISTTQEA